MKFFQLACALLSLSAIVACSKSSLSTGATGAPNNHRSGTAQTPEDAKAVPVPMATPLDRNTLSTCADDLLSKYAKVIKACAGSADPFTHSACFNAKDAFDEKHPDTTCKSAGGDITICNRTDGSCAGLPTSDLVGSDD